jgi:uncharacterized protein (TIGR03000 family)
MIGWYALTRSAVLAIALSPFVAQPGLAGGGHGGGGHAGGSSHGGGGSVQGGFNGHAGSWHGGDFHHDGHFHDGHFHDHDSFGFGIGIGFYPGWGWGWPGYGWGNGYYGPWYDYPPYYGSYGNGYRAASDHYDYQPEPSGSANKSSTAQPLSANVVALRIFLPADAQVWIQGAATRQQGRVRIFESPELTPGVEYTYDIRAQWIEGGRQVEKTRHVTVHPGDRLTVIFTQAPGPGAAPMPREVR